jgi:hypothetical protein
MKRLSSVVVVTLLTASAFAFASAPALAAQPEQTPPLPVAPEAAPPPAPAPSSVPPPTAAPPESALPSNPDHAASGPPRYDRLRVNVGYRVNYVPSGGYDAFSTNNDLPQFSIDATYPVYHQGRFVFGVGAGWDVGGSSATFRGFDASLTAHRLYVPLEAQWHVAPWLFAFGKVSPGAAAMFTKVTELPPGTALQKLDGSAWAFAVDASVGASILMGPRKGLDKRGAPHFWVTPEVGYALATNAPIKESYNRAERDVLGSDESVRLQSLALSGFFWRASMGVTF